MRNILRTAIIALVMLAMVSASVPTTDSFARFKGRNSMSRRYSKKRAQRNRRAWRLRQRRAAAARRRRAMLMRRRMQSAAAPVAVGRPTPAGDSYPTLTATSPFNSGAPQLAQPAGWSRVSGSTSSGEAKWNVRASDGRVVGAAVLRPVSVQAQSDSGISRPRLKPIGGVPITSLRRTVIDRMVAAGGWVVNDWVREIGGRRVYVVAAQTGAPNGPTSVAQSWSFYFFEAGDRIYSLTTNAAPEFSQSLTGQSEMLVASLGRGGDGVQTANSAK